MLQGKRTRTHDDTGDGHDIHTEVDEWDLRDFLRETTHVQNRRNVTLGPLHDQPKPRTGKDGFLFNVRLCLVGWIVYWCNGDSDLTVDVVLTLIIMIDLKEIVSVALVGTKHKEADAWWCVQAREVWSIEEEVHIRPGHFGISKFGTVPGNMICVEKKFELQDHKWEQYKGMRYNDRDRALVVELSSGS